MSEEMRQSTETILSWEAWLRQGLLSPEVVARLEAISRRRIASTRQVHSPHNAEEEGGDA